MFCRCVTDGTAHYHLHTACEEQCVCNEKYVDVFVHKKPHPTLPEREGFEYKLIFAKLGCKAT